MGVLKIVTYGAPVLRKIAAPIGDIKKQADGLSLDMLDTVKIANGIGLAAPQVGYSLRMIIVDLSVLNSAIKPVVMIDPEILELKGSAKAAEGCLSVPKIETEVDRATEIWVRCKTLDGKIKEFKAQDLFARVIQHEVDHLDGKLIIDYQGFLDKNLSKLKLKLPDFPKKTRG